MERAEIGGIPMRWLESGRGRPVVFVHGIPTSPLLWRHVIPLLDDVHALAWEMVGYGQSWAAGEGRDISLRAQADYLVEWLDTVGVDAAVIVGHDLGGGVAQIVAVEHPERCTGLVLTNAVAYDSWPIPSVKASRLAGGIVARAPRIVVRAVIATLARRGHDDHGRASQAIETHWPLYDHAQGAEALVRQMRSLRTQDTIAVASRLTAVDRPAAVVWGAADQFQKLSYGRRLAADLRATIDEIPGGKHFVPEDHPERVARAVERVSEQASTRRVAIRAQGPKAPPAP